jgi:hypothetical protein
VDALSGYFWSHGAYHLVEGRGRSALRKRLFDVGILANKLAATDTNALLADFERLDLVADEPARAPARCPQAINERSGADVPQLQQSARSNAEAPVDAPSIGLAKCSA